MSSKKLYSVLGHTKLVPLDPDTWFERLGEEITAEGILRYLSPMTDRVSYIGIKQRYDELVQKKELSFIAPPEESILHKLIIPLNNALTSYMLGNYVATIALCGMVSEMVAILKFEISAYSLGSNSWSKSKQKKIFGSVFEKLGQDKRVKVLSAMELISPEEKADFDRVRTIRKKYLHFFNQSYDDLKNDSVDCFKSSFNLVASFFGQVFENGQVEIDEDLAKYLQKKSIYVLET